MHRESQEMIAATQLEDAQVDAAIQISADPLPLGPGEWQGAVSSAAEATVQEAISKAAQPDPLQNMPYSIDRRPVSEQRSE